MKQLGPRLPRPFQEGIKRDDQEGLATVLRLAGLMLRSDGRRQVIASREEDTAPNFEIVPLTNEAGSWLLEAHDLLTDSRFFVSEVEAERNLSGLQDRVGDAGWEKPGTSLEEIQRALSFDVSPNAGMDLIAKYVAPRADIFLLRATQRVHAREILWRLMRSATEEGGTFEEFKMGRLRPIDPATGHIHPARYVTSMMTARVQPFALTFATPRFAQVVAVPKKGVMNRPITSGGWPIAGSSSLGGPGVGMYLSRHKTVPEGFAQQVLSLYLEGANSLLERVTAPETWSTPDRELDLQEQAIAWSSIQFGLEAVHHLGKDWSEQENLWTAFRALGTLEGLVDGRLSLTDILTPSTIHRLALDCYPPGTLRDIEEDTVRAYEANLKSVDPQASRGAKHMTEVRNLLHGTGTNQGTRTRRLTALRLLDDANVQVVADLARIWWSAVLLNPARFVRYEEPQQQSR